MKQRHGQIGTLVYIFLAALLGAVVGLIVGFTPLFQPPPVEKLTDWPLPHHVPKYPGAVTLRYPMVHDVIHERFPRHGSAYYEERNRRVRLALEAENAKRGADGKPTPDYFVLLDDLGVGLDLLGQHEEAVQLMRDKLAEQQKLGIQGRDLYGSYANLGTFLILWQLSEGFGDKAKTKERIQESVALVHKSIEVNPQSHFGREVWQAVIEVYLLALLDNPELVLKYDMVGNRLDKEINPEGGQAYSHLFRERSIIRGVDTFLKTPASQQTEEAREDSRSLISRVGAEEGWKEAARTSHKEPVPFDEPTLGIIGMWRYGGGANPHFALALGEIMLRVGQRYLAWDACERAAQMAKFTGPESIAQKFTEHCRRRQKSIEDTLPAEEVAKLRSRFDAELKLGKDYQQAYQDYEAKRIAAGASIDDPHFYDAFHKEHGPIATPVTEADIFRTVQGPKREVAWAAVLLFAGGFAFVTAVLLRLRAAVDQGQRVRLPDRED